MNIRPWLATLVVIIQLGTPSFSQDYQNNQLQAVYGKKFYTGKKDCDASVSLTSKENKIIINVAVKDDSIVLKEDFNHSDHIEFWFSMDSIPNDYFVYEEQFYAGEEVINPTRKNDFIEFINEKANYFNYEEEETVNLTPDNVKVVKELTGLVHWAFDLKKLSSFQFDREYYLKMELPENLEKYITIQKQEVKGGYNATITLEPEALLFFKNVKNDRIYFMIDVFDTDGQAKDLSVLSTAPGRKWGAPEHFTTAKIASPIELKTVAIPNGIISTPALYFFDKSNAWNFYYRSEQTERFGETYFTYDYRSLKPETKSEKRKDGLTIETITYTVEEIAGYTGTKYKIKFNDKEVETNSYGCENTLTPYKVDIAGKNTYAIQVSGCSLRNPWGMGMCGACMDQYENFYILKDNNLYPILELSYTEDGMSYNIKDEYAQGEVLKFNWAKKFSGYEIQTRQVEYGEENDVEKCFQYQITWDKNYKTTMSKKEIPCPPKKETE